MKGLSAALILRRRLNMIDDKHPHGALLRLQFQPQLLLKRGEKRRTRWVCSSRTDLGVAQSGSRAVVRHPLEDEVIAALNSGLVYSTPQPQSGPGPN